jgi:hypothetical protein
MNKFFIANIILLISMLLSFSCTSFSNRKNVQNENLEKVDTIDYHYIWINKSYLSELKKEKSQSKLWDKYKISYIGIAPNDFDLEVSEKFSTHNLYRQMIVNNNLLLISTEDNNAEILKVKWIKKGKSFQIGDDIFIKTKYDDPVCLLEALLYSSTYYLNDKKVVFKKNGGISNLDNYTYFTARQSYQETKSKFDIIELKKDLQLAEAYCAEFKGDTLFLFETMCIEMDATELNCINYKKGPLRYKLIRK